MRKSMSRICSGDVPHSKPKPTNKLSELKAAKELPEERQHDKTSQYNNQTNQSETTGFTIGLGVHIFVLPSGSVVMV